MMMRRIAVISGYAANARWWAEAGETVGYIPRQADIPSPYCYEPTDIVLMWRGRRVIHRETRHRRYEVFEVPADMVVEVDEQALMARLFPAAVVAGA